ncbi:MAG TPA: c-type cytochrome [Solirubrobacteraceae bacterium]|nr:c-type cytochrome [Solirubrobacteraceae bacterium]
MTRRLAMLAAVAVLVVTALVAAGVGQGSPPPAYPVSAQAARSEIAAVAHGSALARRGEQLFDTHGCGDCHTMAAGHYGGRLGPRLDAILQGTGVSQIEADIIHPPHNIPGFEAGLMPENFGSRLPHADIEALAAFLQTAARGAASGGGH